MTTLNHLTVGRDLYGRDMLYTHPTPEAAQDAIDNSPISDGVMMSSTTYHRPATKSDVRRLKYDQTGDVVVINQQSN